LTSLVLFADATTSAQGKEEEIHASLIAPRKKFTPHDFSSIVRIGGKNSPFTYSQLQRVITVLSKKEKEKGSSPTITHFEAPAFFFLSPEKAPTIHPNPFQQKRTL
jgi:hypothetical protein